MTEYAYLPGVGAGSKEGASLATSGRKLSGGCGDSSTGLRSRIVCWCSNGSGKFCGWNGTGRERAGLSLACVAATLIAAPLRAYFDLANIVMQEFWDEVRKRTEDSPYAQAFFTLVEELGIVDAPD